LLAILIQIAFAFFISIHFNYKFGEFSQVKQMIDLNYRWKNLTKDYGL